MGAVGSSLWRSCWETRLLTLQMLQNRAARIVTNSSCDAPADVVIHELDWPTIAEIIKRDTATMVCKSLNGLAPGYLSNIFVRNSSRDTVYLRNSALRLPCECVFSKWLIGRNHLYIVVLVFGTAWNPRLNKHPLYLYLDVDFDVSL